MILTPFLFAIIVPFLYKTMIRLHTGWFVLCVPFSLFVTFLYCLPAVSKGALFIQSTAWIPSYQIHFTIYLDGLALLFSLIITGIGLLVVLYSIFYMSKEREALHNFYVYLLLFMGAMLGTVLSDNLLLLYTFWEITSFSSFLLIAYWYQRERSRYGAQKSLLITVFGGFAMLFGFLLLYAISGTLSIRELLSMVDQVAVHPLFIPAMLLILLGAFTKSVQFPFHIWLPDAMEAPTPISAYLHSATMVKAGIYLIARLTPLFGGSMIWFWLLVVFGMITLFWGAFIAVRQTDLKALLAYSTISQLGLIICLLGIGSTAINPKFLGEALLFSGAILAALFHLINHSIFKGCLFMVIGILDHETGTRDIRKLGGLMTLMPISFTLTLIGAFSMAGLPPFSGFLSKELFFTGVLTAYRQLDQWVLLLPIFAWLASIFTFIYCLILIFKTFTGPFQPQLLDKPPREAPLGMLVPPAILAVGVIIFFFFPNLLTSSVLAPAMYAILPRLMATQDVPLHIQIWHGWNMELMMTIGIVLLGTYLFIRLPKWNFIYHTLPPQLTLNYAYDQSLQGLDQLSGRWTRLYMTGDVRHYLFGIFLFLLLFLGGGLFYDASFSTPF